MPNPYENLWIYYFKGVIKDRELEKLIFIDENCLRNRSFIGNWEEDGFSFLFFSAPSDHIVQNIVERYKNISLIDKYEMRGEEWHGEAIESYKSGSLCISPPWKIPFINDPKLNHILLDPGVVFGTGRHPTTEDCLRYIEYIFNYELSNLYVTSLDNSGDSAFNSNKNLGSKINKEPISTVIDFGTGTGILAVAAATFGCNRVLAVDFNLLAVKTAKNNIKLNSLENKILAVQGRAEDFASLPVDLVVANIHYDVMRHLLEVPQFFEHKWLILSGLLKSEVDKVLTKIKQGGVKVVEATSSDGIWNTILVKGNKYVSCNSKADSKY